MAYTAANLSLISCAPLTGAGQIWRYSEALAATSLDADGYITDGGSRGMQVGDLVIHYNTTTAAAVVVTTHVVNTVSSTYPGAVNLGLGTEIGSSTSGD